jgi:2-C-methyl-D-erythritol 4-phosphate cytidylyltransferase
MKKYVIIVAGGKGQRMNVELPKQFISLNGKPVLMHTIEAFYEYDEAITVILVLPSAQISYWKDLCKKHVFSFNCQIVSGGDSRFYSVKNGLDVISDSGLVAIHDGVRPFANKETIDSCFKAASEFGSGIPVVELVDSIRQIDGNKSVAVDRGNYKLVQTPQVFDVEKIKQAYTKALTVDATQFTDDASVFSFAAYNIQLVEGNRENIKITTPFDLIVAEAILKNRL